MVKRRSKGVLIAAGGIVALGGIAAAYAYTQGAGKGGGGKAFAVTITVRDQSTFIPLSANVSVDFGSPQPTDPTTGEIAFSLPAGQHTFVATSNGYLQGGVTLDIQADTSYIINMQKGTNTTGKFSYQVIVTDQQAYPVPNSSVRLNGFSGMTDNNGQVTLYGIPTGAYTLTVSATGYETASKQVGIFTSSGIQIALYRVQITFTVHVTDAGTGQAIQGATADYDIISALTDASGNATLTTSATSGTLSVAAATGYLPYVAALSPQKGQTYNVTLKPGVGIAGAMVYKGFSNPTQNQVTVSYENVYKETLYVQAMCDVRNSLGQTMAFGLSAVQPVQPVAGGLNSLPGPVVAFVIVLNSTLSHGTYTFNFFCLTSNGVVASDTTPITITV